MIDITEKLDRLAQNKAQVDLLRLDYEDKRKAILAQVQAELDELDAEYNPTLNAGRENISELESEIKSMVLNYGESVKGAHLHAVFSGGTKRWDLDGVKAYAKLHPEMKVFEKIGEPSVTIRASK